MSRLRTSNEGLSGLTLTVSSTVRIVARRISARELGYIYFAKEEMLGVKAPSQENCETCLRLLGNIWARKVLTQLDAAELLRAA